MRAILRSPSEYWPELQRDMAFRIDAVLLLLAVYAWSREVSLPYADGRLVVLGLGCACICLASRSYSGLPG